METKEGCKIIQRLLSITETGLAFSRDEFDQERYLESVSFWDTSWLIGQIWMGKNWQSCCAQRILRHSLIDVRAVLVRDGKVCLVKGKWEYLGFTWRLLWSRPISKENIVKEVQEETGFNVSVSRLLAILILINFNFRVSNMLNWSSSVR